MAQYGDKYWKVLKSNRAARRRGPRQARARDGDSPPVSKSEQTKAQADSESLSMRKASRRHSLLPRGFYKDAEENDPHLSQLEKQSIASELNGPGMSGSQPEWLELGIDHDDHLEVFKLELTSGTTPRKQPLPWFDNHHDDDASSSSFPVIQEVYVLKSGIAKTVPYSMLPQAQAWPLQVLPT